MVTRLTHIYKMHTKFFVCFLAVLLASCQQTGLLPADVAIEGGVPRITVSNFYNQFSDSQNVVWTQMAGQAWFVKFSNKNVQSGIFWNDEGHILSNGILISTSDLPKAVFKNLQINVPLSKILNVIKMYQNPANNLITDGYMAAVQKGNRIYCVRFTNSGDFVSILPRLKQ
jgi:hypothetical protein